jgi:Pyruvate/2-oxoacid:ferredoxin oxidoreductase delta subunit
MKIRRNIIEIDEKLCNGCGQCVSACAEGAIQLVNGKAKLVAENYCDGLAACLGECPEGALKIVERNADAFDPEAVEQYLKNQGQGFKMFASPCEEASQPAQHADIDSCLNHWPVQIKLIPPAAPFLRGADILVASDCAPVAYPGFHKNLLKGKTVLMGCPKFDNTEEYINKFADIFRVADVKSVTVLIMEVPCCSKMPLLVQQGMALAGKEIPVEVVVVSTRGKILKKEKL